MKALIRHFLFSVIAIWALATFIPGFSYSNDYQTLFLAGFVMFFLNLIAKPILKIVFLPVNLLTLGLFNYVIVGGLFYALTIFVPELKVSAWMFEGFKFPILNYMTLSVPPYYITFWVNIFLLAALYNLIVGFLNWLCD